MLQLTKIGEVGQLTVTAHPSNKDHFADPLVQQVFLPGTFFPGDSYQLVHACLQCNYAISFNAEYGSLIAAKTWSLKRIGRNQRELLDQVGRLLHLKLDELTEGGVEVAYYYTAVLSIATVGYYRCSHCAAQYLIGHARHGTDNEGRGMPESDTMHVQCIAQVTTDEPELLRALNLPVPAVQ